MSSENLIVQSSAATVANVDIDSGKVIDTTTTVINDNKNGTITPTAIVTTNLDTTSSTALVVDSTGNNEKQSYHNTIRYGREELIALHCSPVEAADELKHFPDIYSESELTPYSFAAASGDEQRNLSYALSNRSSQIYKPGNQRPYGNRLIVNSSSKFGRGVGGNSAVGTTAIRSENSIGTYSFRSQNSRFGATVNDDVESKSRPSAAPFGISASALSSSSGSTSIDPIVGSVPMNSFFPNHHQPFPSPSSLTTTGSSVPTGGGNLVDGMHHNRIFERNATTTTSMRRFDQQRTEPTTRLNDWRTNGIGGGGGMTSRKSVPQGFWRNCENRTLAESYNIDVDDNRSSALPEWATDNEVVTNQKNMTFDNQGVFVPADSITEDGGVERAAKFQKIDPQKIEFGAESSLKDVKAEASASCIPMRDANCETASIRQQPNNNKDNHTNRSKKDGLLLLSESSGARQREVNQALNDVGAMNSLLPRTDDMVGRAHGGGLNFTPDESKLEAEIHLSPLLVHWEYIDPQGNIRGPFNATQMSKWYVAGYFTSSIMLKRSFDRKFCHLGEYVHAFGDKFLFHTGSMNDVMGMTKHQQLNHASLAMSGGKPGMMNAQRNDGGAMMGNIDDMKRQSESAFKSWDLMSSLRSSPTVSHGMPSVTNNNDNNPDLYENGIIHHNAIFPEIKYQHTNQQQQKHITHRMPAINNFHLQQTTQSRVHSQQQMDASLMASLNRKADRGSPSSVIYRQQSTHGKLLNSDAIAVSSEKIVERLGFKDPSIMGVISQQSSPINKHHGVVNPLQAQHHHQQQMLLDLEEDDSSQWLNVARQIRRPNQRHPAMKLQQQSASDRLSAQVGSSLLASTGSRYSPVESTSLRLDELKRSLKNVKMYDPAIPEQLSNNLYDLHIGPDITFTRSGSSSKIGADYGARLAPWSTSSGQFATDKLQHNQNIPSILAVQEEEIERNRRAAKLNAQQRNMHINNERLSGPRGWQQSSQYRPTLNDFRSIQMEEMSAMMSAMNRHHGESPMRPNSEQLYHLRMLQHPQKSANRDSYQQQQHNLTWAQWDKKSSSTPDWDDINGNNSNLTQASGQSTTSNVTGRDDSSTNKHPREKPSAELARWARRQLIQMYGPKVNADAVIHLLCKFDIPNEMESFIRQSLGTHSQAGEFSRILHSKLMHDKQLQNPSATVQQSSNGAQEAEFTAAKFDESCAIDRQAVANNGETKSTGSKLQSLKSSENMQSSESNELSPSSIPKSPNRQLTVGKRRNRRKGRVVDDSQLGFKPSSTEQN